MTSCVVTGGAGFIGCALSGALAERFDEVVAVDVLHPQVHLSRTRPAALDARVRLDVADVTLAATWDDLLSEVKPDVVVHLAAETGTGVSLTEATRHAMVNVVGTTQLVDALVRHEAQPRAIVLASSRAVYGEGAWRDGDQTVYPGQRTHEELAAHRWQWPGLTPVRQRASVVEARPVNVYGATKLAQENLVGSWCQAMGVVPIVLRLQNVYGEGQSLTNPYTGIVPLFAGRARSGGVIPVFEDGQIVRDFVHVSDVVAAIIAALDRGEATTVPFDIGTGLPTTIAALARVVASVYGAPDPVVTGEFRDGDVRYAVADVTDAVTRLGWEPRVDLETGVARLCAWIDGSDR